MLGYVCCWEPRDVVCHLQVMQQFPLSFEFNERFLHTLFVHSYYSVYGKPAFDKVFLYFAYVHTDLCVMHVYSVGDFLYDAPKERSRQKLAGNTQSLW